MTFRDENRALQELARELDLVRKHNLRFREGDSHNELLMFAEAGLVIMTMEHFVRIVVGAEAPEDATLRTLLDVAIARGLLRLPWDNQQDGIRKVCAIRNTLLHTNYAQAARQARCSSVNEYFKTQFAGELESMFKITDFIMKQIDSATGKPRPADVVDRLCERARQEHILAHAAKV